MTKRTSNKNTSTVTAPTNTLRLAAISASSGIIITGASVTGVAGATNTAQAIFTTSLAVLVAGATCAAAIRYIFTTDGKLLSEPEPSPEDDTPTSTTPKEQILQLAHTYADMGVRKRIALEVAKELHKNGVHEAPTQTAADTSTNRPALALSPLQTLLSYGLGGLIPFIAILVAPEPHKLLAAAGASLLALAAAGYFATQADHASRLKIILQLVLAGLITMGVAYSVGAMFGTLIG